MPERKTVKVEQEYNVMVTVTRMVTVTVTAASENDALGAVSDRDVQEALSQGDPRDFGDWEAIEAELTD